MKLIGKIFLGLGLFFLTSSCREDKPVPMRGIILSVEDLETVDWAKLAHENGINTIGTHITPRQVADFMQSEKGQKFNADCRKYGIFVEHQLHAMKELLPRELFAEDTTMFRMDSEGRRTDDWNCCPSSEKALGIIAENAAKYAELLPASNHRYYFWLDDGKPTCRCPSCSELSASDQALIIENIMIKAIRKVDPQAQLAHLAYLNTLPAPEKVSPAEGIFLEFAAFFYRSWETPLSNPEGSGREMTHADILEHLKDNLKIFPAETAVVLEYWLDVSLFSDWKKPAVELPWRRDVFESDLHTYSEFGLENVTSFAVYMDSVYFSKYPDTGFLKEYGEGSAKPYLISSAKGFHAPWEGLEDDTGFICSADSSVFRFRYAVKDSSLTLSEPYTGERCVDNEDRVEIFFSAGKDMDIYYCAEIDPMGRIMDYSCRYYRQMDYDWGFRTLKTEGRLTDDGYVVDGQIDLRELAGLGIDPEDGFYMGLFRADFRPDMSVSWYSWIDNGAEEADFHKPDVLFPARLR